MAHESLRAGSTAIASVPVPELDRLEAADATLPAFADDMLTARVYAAAKRPFPGVIAPPRVAERPAPGRADVDLDALLATARAQALADPAEWGKAACGAVAPLLGAPPAEIAGRECPVDDLRVELDYLLHLIGPAEHALDRVAMAAHTAKLVAGTR